MNLPEANSAIERTSFAMLWSPAPFPLATKAPTADAAADNPAAPALAPARVVVEVTELCCEPKPTEAPAAAAAAATAARGVLSAVEGDKSADELLEDDTFEARADPTDPALDPMAALVAEAEVGTSSS